MFIWMAIAIMSMFQAQANRKQADRWWSRLRESQAQTQEVLDKWNKTIADYNAFIDSVNRAHNFTSTASNTTEETK